MANDEPPKKPTRKRAKTPKPPETPQVDNTNAAGVAPEAVVSAPDLPQSNPQEKSPGFTPEVLDRTVIAIPLLKLVKQGTGLESAAPEVFSVIIDLNMDYEGGRESARDRVKDLIKAAIDKAGGSSQANQEGVDEAKSEFSDQYLFARLSVPVIQELVRLDSQGEPEVVKADGSSDTAPPAPIPAEAPQPTEKPRYQRAIFRIWPDFAVKGFINRSISTVKADAARASFNALGKDIVWAVVDSGIQGDHPHFSKHENLKLDKPLKHRDFTSLKLEDGQPLEDEAGHGTHVAGILAGEMTATADTQIRAMERYRNENGDVSYKKLKLDTISGMAPSCKLVSLKVLDANGDGQVSSIIAALGYIQRLNNHGRRLVIHGVNLSIGYPFEPEWFACGQSPLCVEVNRLVRSGVVVVVAAGNTGYGWLQSTDRGAVAAGMDLTINDPGNADLAITVGSTHRDMPHVYGVSYFSSKGPTGDGRLKPDLVAPGEKILSAAAGKLRSAAKDKGWDTDYAEDSGTSMAAPHVSGVIAAFLSVRREYIGQPEAVKDIFLSSATDLKRDKNFQGNGLVDLMRAIQAV